jgi:hypothetical protein
MNEQNPFGGGNPHSLYTPITECEQEVLDRLVDAGDLVVHLVGWGEVRKLSATFGDKRVTVKFRVFFQSPTLAVPVHYFDMELRTRSGILLYSERKPASVNGSPAMVGAGIGINFTWWIQFNQMTEDFVRLMKPGARGLTTREGNRKMTEDQQELLHFVRQAEARSKADDAQQAEKATTRAQDDEDDGTVLRLVH